MIRALAYIETVKALDPIPNADKIEKATVLGWELVVKKGEFSVGDIAIYCEIDSRLPVHPSFAFMEKYKYRIKTQKMRGVISQGLLLPISVIQEVNPNFDIASLKVGDDVTEVLGIVKYETADEQEDREKAEAEDNKMTYWEKKVRYWRWKLFGIKPQKSSGFPSDVPKTDETRVQKMGGLLFDKMGSTIYVSEKAEGTSGTFIWKNHSGNWLTKFFGAGGTLFVCSRNRVISNSDKGGETTHPIYKVAVKYDLKSKLSKLGRNLAIQGEVIGVDKNGGKAIQGNIYKLSDFELRVFSIYDIDAKSYASYDELISLSKELGLTTVPMLGTHSLVNDIPYYVELSKGMSQINPKVRREGIVIRALDSSFSFKAINPEYLLSSEL